ncbi:MAG TPA: DUF3426 domain-containing protein [Beijerinckiaceae bacterium]|nr:DUF3426 domain-containing protein [Beijerinckiaceae bacterium]
MTRIQCPTCDATYDLPQDSIGPAGRKVRCAACKTLWVASAEPVAPRLSIMMPEPEQSATPAQRTARPWYERLRAEDRRARAPLGWRLAAGLVVVACLGGAVMLRRPIVAAVPETGAAYAALGLPVNLRGLDLRGVQSSLVNEAGNDMLVVQGEIVNISNQKKALPRLHFTVRDARGLTLYSWTAQADAKDVLPGQSLQFRRRLASPPSEGQDVLVRFAQRADLVASTR